MICHEFIVEDGTCVDGANTFALPACAAAYWTNRFGGEKWDKSFEGENHCDDSIKKALIGAMDYLNGLSWGAQYCKQSCVPTPISCDCYGKPTVELLKEAQIILADGILRGWNPYAVSKPSGPLVSSISSPDEGSVTFARPTTMGCYTGAASTQDIGREVVSRVKALLKPILKQSKGIRILT